MSHGELALAYAGVILQMWLLLAMLRGGHHKRFPAFFLCTFFSIAGTIAVLLVRNSPISYLWVYWVSESLNVVLVFFALHEIFRTMFSNFYRMAWFRLLFPGIGILMLLVSVLGTVLRPAPSGSRLFTIIISLEIAVGFLQMGIFCLFLVLIGLFHVRSRQQAFGLALGFGVLASAYLVVFLLRSEFGKKLDPVVRITPPIAYTVALVVWLATFLFKEPGSPQLGVASGLTPEQMLADLKRYTAVAKRIFRQ